MTKISREETSGLIPPDPKKNASKLKTIGVIVGGVLVLLAIWQASINPFGKFRSAAVSILPPLASLTPLPNAALLPSPEPDLADVQASIAALLIRIEKLESAPPAAKEEAVNVSSSSPAPAVAFQPQSLYLGSSSTTSREWMATGLEVQVVSGDYPADIVAVFEAGLSIIGGEAWARLKNKTTGAIISASEVMHNNSTVTWKSSPAFKLHGGSNVYAVELRSSSGETANLSGSRIKLSQ